MEATIPGLNRTGATASPQGTQAMTDAVNELTPPVPIDTGAMEAERLLYINESETVGSIPPPQGIAGGVKSGLAALKGGSPGVFMDKIGERIAFERGGVRLYEALIAKYQAATQAAGDVLPRAGVTPTSCRPAPPSSTTARPSTNCSTPMGPTRRSRPSCTRSRSPAASTRRTTTT